MNNMADCQPLIEKYKSDYQDFDLLRRHIVDYFSPHPKAASYVHSVKSRLKDPDHLTEKIVRKWKTDDAISVEIYTQKLPILRVSEYYFFIKSNLME